MSEGRYDLVLLRHGESQYGADNLFCGWHDSDLTDNGVSEAKYSGQQLRTAGAQFDLAFTSILKRAVKTLQLIQEELDLHWVPVVRSWRLCERHYGALQGLSKSETAAKYGEDQVKIWRRSYDVRPPPLDPSDPRWQGNMRTFQHLPPGCIPLCESLQDTIERVMPLWFDQIAPAILSNKRVLVVAHGSVIRSLVKYLDKISDQDIIDVNIPTGIPIVYHLGHDLQALSHHYLSPREHVREQVEKVINQGKMKAEK